MAGSQTKSRTTRKSSKRKPQAKRTTSSKPKAKRTTSSKPQAKRRTPTKRASPKTASDYAKVAASEWGDAVRYGAAAIAPMPKLLAERVKDSTVWSRVSSRDGSLKDRLNPTTTEKGGQAGDLADALLAKLGTPGKMASKASLGSRIVDRMLPDDFLEEESEESEEPEEDSDGEPEDIEFDDMVESGGVDPDEEEPPSPRDSRERDDVEAESGRREPEPDEPAESGEPEEPPEPDEFAETEPEHAYAGAVRSYRRPPNAYTREPDEL
jgi:hypothetical protein